MLYFNELQLRQLPSCFSLSQMEFSSRCFSGRKYIFPQRLAEMDRLLVSDVVSICNAMHIPISFIISPTPPGKIIRDSSMSVSPDEWNDIKLTPEKLIDVYTSKSDVFVTKRRMCEVLGITEGAFYQWTHSPDSFCMKVSQLIELCNVCKISITTVVNDQNSIFAGSGSDTAEALESLRKRIIRCGTKINALASELDELKKQLTFLESTI